MATKDELAEHAKGIGIDLDMRKSLENLRKEVSEIKVQPELVPVAPESKGFLLNKATGLWFPWSKPLADRGDLIPCDENGK
jgi:hypothetical protein